MANEDFLTSDRTRKIFWALKRLHITNLLLRIGMKFYGRANHFNLHEFRYFAVGQSHLDTAWCWRWEPDTAPYKISHTMGYNLDNLRKFPQRNARPGYQDGYKFSFSAAVHYEYMQQHWPRAFAKLKTYVQQGRWELLGGMWVESDCNIPDGESLVRQRLYGQKYFMHTFGKKAVVEWLPDSFGFCWTLPQILIKSGAKYFHTTKLTWIKSERPGCGEIFPFEWFYWESPDGSRILSHNYWGGWRGLEKVGKVKDYGRLLESSQSEPFNYAQFSNEDTRLSKKFIPEFLWIYGQGDGGHGPTQLEIMVTDTCEQIGQFQQIKAGVFCNLIKHKYADRLPIWNDEMYLQLHRGVQTTLHTLKLQNRQGEIGLQNMEKFGSLLQPFGFQLDSNQLDNAWKKVLFNQFHDILPGSSIQEVYEDATRDYETIIFPTLQTIQDQIANYFKVFQNSSTSDLSGFVFYPHHWDQVYKITHLFGSADNTVFFHRKPPGIGWEQLSEDILEHWDLPMVNEEENTIEITTPDYRIVLGKHEGCIMKMNLMDHAFDFTENGLNILRIFEDNPDSDDAWEIDDYYREKPCTNPVFDLPEITTEPNQIVVHFPVHMGDKSQGILEYAFTTALPYIECSLNLDWQEAHRLLRVEFDTNIQAERYTTGIPYGWITRSANPQTKIDQGRWEVPGQLFLDYTNDAADYGLTLLVFDRYGFNVKKNLMGLSLLRAPSYGPPDRNACAWYDLTTEGSRQQIKDLGHHQLRWGIYPHQLGWQENGVIPKALAFNFGVQIINAVKSESQSLITDSEQMVANDFPVHLNVENVNIAVIKPPYEPNEHGYVIRLIEFEGKTTLTTLSWNVLINNQIQETDLLEQPLPIQQGWYQKNNQLIFEIHPFEIKTFKLLITS